MFGQNSTEYRFGKGKVNITEVGCIFWETKMCAFHVRPEEVLKLGPSLSKRVSLHLGASWEETHYPPNFKTSSNWG